MTMDFSAIWMSFLLAVVVGAAGQFLYSGYKVRSRVNRLRKMDLVRFCLIRLFLSRFGLVNIPT